MKRILLAAIAAAAISTPAFAADTTIDISGTASARCGVDAATPITLGELANGDGSLNAAAVNVSQTAVVGNAFCTGTSNTVEIDADPLLRVGGTPPGTPGTFGTQINYSVALSAGALSLSNATANAATSVSGVPAFTFATGDVAISGATLTGGATKILAGDYEGSVTVTLTPGV